MSDCPSGTVELTLSIELPVEAIIRHWTRDEVAELLAGDECARDELITQATHRNGAWSRVEVDDAHIVVDGRRL